MPFGVGGPPQWPKLTGLQLPADHKLQETPYPILTGFAHPWTSGPHHPWDLSTIALRSCGIPNRIYGTKLFMKLVKPTQVFFFCFKMLPPDFNVFTSDIEYLTHGYIDESPTNKTWFPSGGVPSPLVIHPAHISVIAPKGVYNYFSVGEFQMMSYHLGVLKVWLLWAKPDH